MGVNYVLGLRLRVHPPPGASLFFETPGGVLGFIWGEVCLFHLLVVVVVVIKWRAKYRTDWAEIFTEDGR